MKNKPIPEPLPYIYDLADSIIKKAVRAKVDLDYYHPKIVLSMAYAIDDFAKEFKKKEIKVYVLNRVSKQLLNLEFLERNAVVYINHLFADRKPSFIKEQRIMPKLPEQYGWCQLPINHHSPFAFAVINYAWFKQ